MLISTSYFWPIKSPSQLVTDDTCESLRWNRKIKSILFLNNGLCSTSLLHDYLLFFRDKYLRWFYQHCKLRLTKRYLAWVDQLLLDLTVWRVLAVRLQYASTTWSSWMSSSDVKSGNIHKWFYDIDYNRRRRSTSFPWWLAHFLVRSFLAWSCRDGRRWSKARERPHPKQ